MGSDAATQRRRGAAVRRRGGATLAAAPPQLAVIGGARRRLVWHGLAVCALGQRSCHDTMTVVWTAPTALAASRRAHARMATARPRPQSAPELQTGLETSPDDETRPARQFSPCKPYAAPASAMTRVGEKRRFDPEPSASARKRFWRWRRLEVSVTSANRVDCLQLGPMPRARVAALRVACCESHVASQAVRTTR